MTNLQTARPPAAPSTRGRPSTPINTSRTAPNADPYRLSQSHSGNIYHYVWIDNVAIEGAIELPAGVSAQDVAITLEQGETTPITLNDNGTFLCNSALQAVEAVVSIRIPGYYEATFGRSASLMQGTWNLGTISAESFKEVPATRSFTLSITQKTGQKDEYGNDTLAAITDQSKLSYALKRNGVNLTCGENGDYEIQGGRLVLSEALASETGILDQLSLEIVPDDSLKLSFRGRRIRCGVGRLQGNPPLVGRRRHHHQRIVYRSKSRHGLRWHRREFSLRLRRLLLGQLAKQPNRPKSDRRKLGS